MWETSNTICTGHDASNSALLPGGSTPKDGIFFYHGLNGLNEVVLWRKEEIKKFVAFPGLTPLQPDVYAQPSKRASLSDHPHPSSLSTGRQESIKTK